MDDDTLNTIFDEIRKLVGVPEPKKIHKLNLVKHNDKSFLLLFV